MNLTRTGQRRQKFAGSKVENQLVVGDRKILIMRSVQPGTGCNCGAESGLLAHLALHDGINRIERLCVRREKCVERDRFLRGDVVVEALIEGRRARATEIFKYLQYDTSSAARRLSGVIVLGCHFYLVRHLAGSRSLRRRLRDVDGAVSILTVEEEDRLVGLV